jgi:hypothetical protein
MGDSWVSLVMKVAPTGCQSGSSAEHICGNWSNTRYEVLCSIAILLDITANLYAERRNSSLDVMIVKRMFPRFSSLFTLSSRPDLQSKRPDLLRSNHGPSGPRSSIQPNTLYHSILPCSATEVDIHVPSVLAVASSVLVSKTGIDDVSSTVPALLLVGDAEGVVREPPTAGAVVDLVPASPVVAAVILTSFVQVAATPALLRATLTVAFGCEGGGGQICRDRHEDEGGDMHGFEGLLVLGRGC